MPKGSGISTQFKDYIVPKPEPGSSDWGDFGDVIPGAPGPTKGQMKEVQFLKTKGGESGKQKPMKIPGGGSY